MDATLVFLRQWKQLARCFRGTQSNKPFVCLALFLLAVGFQREQAGTPLILLYAISASASLSAALALLETSDDYRTLIGTSPVTPRSTALGIGLASGTFSSLAALPAIAIHFRHAEAGRALHCAAAVCICCVTCSVSIALLAMHMQLTEQKPSPSISMLRIIVVLSAIAAGSGLASVDSQPASFMCCSVLLGTTFLLTAPGLRCWIVRHERQTPDVETYQPWRSLLERPVPDWIPALGWWDVRNGLRVAVLVCLICTSLSLFAVIHCELIGTGSTALYMMSFAAAIWGLVSSFSLLEMQTQAEAVPPMRLLSSDSAIRVLTLGTLVHIAAAPSALLFAFASPAFTTGNWKNFTTSLLLLALGPYASASAGFMASVLLRRTIHRIHQP